MTRPEREVMAAARSYAHVASGQLRGDPKFTRKKVNDAFVRLVRAVEEDERDQAERRAAWVGAAAAMRKAIGT